MKYVFIQAERVQRSSRKKLACCRPNGKQVLTFSSLRNKPSLPRPGKNIKEQRESLTWHTALFHYLAHNNHDSRK